MNGVPINYAPSLVFNSPFMKSVWGSGKITISAEDSVIGKAFTLDPTSGDVNVRDMSIQQIQGGKEVFVKAWPVA